MASRGRNSRKDAWEATEEPSHGIVRRSRSTSRLIFRERIASAWLWSASHDDLRCLAWANASGFATRIGAPSAKATNASRVSV